MIEDIFPKNANKIYTYISQDKTIEAYISHVNNEKIFMQVKSKGLVCFKRLMKDFSEKMSSSEYQKASIFDYTKVYITKIKYKCEWDRAKIIYI